MKIEPIEQKSFGNKQIYKKTVQTSYGRCIQGGTNKYDYYVYIAENPITKLIKHKLYVVNKIRGEGKENWIKSFLRFFSENTENKMTKEIKSQIK